MPIFNYVATDAGGKETKGVIDAETEVMALSRIREMSLFPLQLTKRAAAAPGAQDKKGGILGGQIKIPFLSSRVSGKELTPFTRQLATLINAGLPLIRSLSVLMNQMKPSALKDIVMGIIVDVESGSSFGDALIKYPKVFSKVFIGMVKAGEAGGVLDKSLERLAEFAEKSAALRGKIKTAMTYPIIVVVVIVGIMAVIFRFVIPTFEEMFADMEMALPAPTRILIETSTFIREQAFLVPLTPIALIALYSLIQKTKGGGLAIDKGKLRIPLMGPLIRKIAVARFSRTLGTLVTSGVPILQALDTARETAGNLVISGAIKTAHDSVKAGETLAAPFEASNVFPPLVSSMISVGEETGNLDEMLLKVADTYDEEVDRAVEALSASLEPIMLVFMGIIVGFIVISLFVPLIQMAMAIA
ncbi:MAG: Type II secretion system protein F [Syntrophomonadaceae bacterium]|nr:Type II secretion system protein F [Bacillota bacterium]MBT9146383.1 Type II secretion system protein F [Bacillota bacterium]